MMMGKLSQSHLAKVWLPGAKEKGRESRCPPLVFLSLGSVAVRGARWTLVM